jgi:putative oxidoreductase
MSMIRNSLSSTASPAVTLIRLAVGGVFLTEGIQKFLYPDALGTGRFTKIGIPAPEITASFVGVVEIVCGALVLLGLLTRLAAIPLIVDMLVAIATTKIPLFFGTGPEPNMQGDKFGFWAGLHQGRLDFAMLMGAIFLLVVGGGRLLSLDARFARGAAPEGDRSGSRASAPRAT